MAAFDCATVPPSKPPASSVLPLKARPLNAKLDPPVMLGPALEPSGLSCVIPLPLMFATYNFEPSGLKTIEFGPLKP